MEATEPPLIVDLQPDNVHVLRGQKFVLKAKFAGEPTPDVRWMQGKIELKTDRSKEGKILPFVFIVSSCIFYCKKI